MTALSLALADRSDFAWAQARAAGQHYLRAPVDPRCSPQAYVVRLWGKRVGLLIFGRPEGTSCYRGALTYGSLEDVATGRATYNYWEVINLARVWLAPRIQRGGRWYVPHAASLVIGAALSRVGYDYLAKWHPVDCVYPYQLRVCLSYCNSNLHSGWIYRACHFKRARTNEDGIHTFFKRLPPLTPEQDAVIRRLSEQSLRSRRYRAARAVAGAEQLALVAWAGASLRPPILEVGRALEGGEVSA